MAYVDFGWKTVVSLIAVDNTASHAVAQRLGARVESPIAFPGGRPMCIGMYRWSRCGALRDALWGCDDRLISVDIFIRDLGC